MLAVQKFILENENWYELLKQKDIEIKYDDMGLLLFKYFISADFHDPVVKECRGLILEDKTWRVVCYPFNKFGNYGESYADRINWSTARVQEKIDGSIMKLYNYGGRWYVSTNGTIFGDAKTASGKTYRDLFWFAAGKQGLNIAKLNPDYTYIFELVSPDAQIVVHYPETKIYHIGTRNNRTLKELNVDIGIEKPKEYPLHSLEDCIDAAKELKSSEHEGYVVVDKNWHRVKVKAPEWVAAHHLANNGNITIKHLLAIIMENEDAEFLTYFPDKTERITKIRKEMSEEKLRIYEWIKPFWYKWRDGELSRKDFAIEYHNHPYFKFAIDVIYNNKNINPDLKYWVRHFEKKEENDGNN